MTISRIVSDNNCKCPRNQILVGSLTSYVSSPLVFLDPSQLWGRQPVSLCHCHVGEIIIFICIFYIEEKYLFMKLHGEIPKHQVQIGEQLR